MDMKARFSSTEGKRYLLVNFSGGSIKLYAKDEVHLDAYDSWENSSAVEVEELTTKEIKNRLTEANRDEKTEQLGKIFRQMLKLNNEFGE